VFAGAFLREELPGIAIRYHKISIKEDLWEKNNNKTPNYSWSKSGVVISGILT